MPKIDKREKFCREYVKDFNGTQAAIRAGYSAKSAESQASRLLRNAKVREDIEKLKKLDAKSDEDDRARLIRELKAIAFAKVGHVTAWNESGVRAKDSGDLSEETHAAIQSVEETTNNAGTRMKFKMHDKGKAMELLAKHFGICNDKQELNHTGEIKVIIEDYTTKTDDNKS